MDVIKNQDNMSVCDNCEQGIWAEVKIRINGIEFKLCATCRKELMKQLVDIF